MAVPPPGGRAEISDNAVAYMARQVGVERTDIAFSDWSGRTIEYHRARIRRALGFRECSVADADAMTWWLVDHVTQAERSPERVREHLLAECRRWKLKPLRRAGSCGPGRAGVRSCCSTGCRRGCRPRWSRSW
ncbi:DUF4158 domain-containing protein [Nocardia farcinica]